MNLTDLASIGTLVSGLAVLASLVYLSMQIRQSDKNQRALMDQGTVTRNIDILIFLSQPHIHALTSRVASGDVDFTAEEIDYLLLRLRATLLAGQDTYIQHEAGLVDKITFKNSVNVLKGVLSVPVYRALWMLSHNAFAHEYVTWVDEQIENRPPISPRDTIARFREALASLAPQA